MQTETSTDISELSRALLNVQKSIQPASKDATNPYLGNKYASLASVIESCRALLTQNQILLTQTPVCAPLELGGGYLALETRLTHVDSGQWMQSVLVMPLPKNDPQGLGSAITYARRYAISAILGIVTEDDDGNAASGVANNKKNNHSKPAVKQVSNEPPDLPQLDGISYRWLKADDGRAYVVATGKTMEKKSILKSAGFIWNPQSKCWWRYAETA